VIVGITEEDIPTVKTYPIPDREIADLLKRLQTYQPIVASNGYCPRYLRVEPGMLNGIGVSQR
jgi:hypothetical protein